MTNMFQDKNILVTGGTGSIGSEVVRKLLREKPRVVRVLDNDETGLFNLDQELNDYPNVRFLVGDVRDKDRLQRAAEDTDFIFHAAALKHVPLCEYNPFEAVKTNVLGTQNVIDVAMEEEVDKLITISTDKAVNPVNVMGATKMLAERLTISANYYKGTRRTAFSCIRFGNVLDSRGSVVPLFREQISKGGPVMITDPEMSRFVMSIPRAVDLVLKAAAAAQGGEVFIFKMNALRIGDLAEVMIEQLAPHYGYDPRSIRREISGKRPGEKVYEELLTEDEAVTVTETDDMLVVTPAVNREPNSGATNRYRSDRDTVFLTREEIRQIVRESLSQAV